MVKFWAVFRRELIEHQRTGKLLLLLLAIFGGIIIALYTEVGPTANSTNVLDPFFELFAILCPIIGIFAAMDAIVGEKESGTLELILSKPLPRSTLLVGKFAAYLVIIIPLLVLELVAAYYWAQYTGISTERWQLDMPSLIHWLSMVAILVMVTVYYTSLTILISLFTRSVAVTGLIGLIFITPAHPLGGEILKKAFSLFNWAGFNQVPFIFKIPISVFGKYQKFAMTSSLDFWICIISLLFISTAILLLSSVIFARQSIAFRS